MRLRHHTHPRHAAARPRPVWLLAAALWLCAGAARANLPASEPPVPDIGRVGIGAAQPALDSAAPARPAALPAPASAAPASDAAAATDRAAPTRVFQGKASFYAAKFTGRSTASGERYSPQALTMAHRALPFGSWVRVTNLQNQRSVVVRVNDRGPFIGRRVADLSKAAARQLNMVGAGVVMARFEVLPGPPSGGLDGALEAEADRARPAGG